MNRSRSRVSLQWILLALLAGALAAALPAVAARGGEKKLPKAEKVLNEFVKASGGKAAFSKIRNRKIEATFEMPAAGLSAPILIYAALPNKNYTLMESDALGKIEKGTDGEVVWELSTMAGPSVKEGDERAEFLKDSTLDRMIHWRENYSELETTGRDEVDGKACYVVRMTPKWGKSETHCFDAESQLPARTAMTVETQMGSIPLTVFFSDYRTVDGLKLAHRVVVEVMQQERVITTQSIEHNVDLPADRFALPAEIAELVAGAK